jgi:signal transduction histidine kinase
MEAHKPNSLSAIAWGEIENFVVVNVNKEKHAPLSPDEAARLRAVNRYHILDTPADGAFDCVAELAARIFKVPIALISIVDEDRIWFKSHHGINISEIDREPELCASAILRDVPTIVTDAKIDPKTLSNSLVAGSFGLRFYAAAPLHTADGFNLGTLCIIDKEPRTLTEAEVKTLQSMAAIVIDQLELRLSARRQDDSESALRAKMQDIIAERTAQLSRLSQELIRNSEEERAKLAGELHDDMGGILTLLTMTLGDMETRLPTDDPRLFSAHRDASGLVRDLIACQRRIVESLRPVLLDNFGLGIALKHHVEQWSQKSGIGVRTSISADIPGLDVNVALAVFRVVQESLTNIAKYANGAIADVAVSVVAEGISVCVMDDGIGIAADVLERPSSHGIVGMRERLSQFGGRLSIGAGQHGRGTRVEGFIPLGNAAFNGLLVANTQGTSDIA